MVGLCLPRGGQMVVATLAIMKAGGCLVPLDPAYPRERLEFMLGDCAAPLLLTQRHLLERLPQWSGQALFLDDHAPSRQDGRAGLPPLDPAMAAYVIYTSGSTGRPKGVVNTHGGLRNLMHNQLQRLGLTPEDRVLQLASPSFDTSIWEMGMAMAAGACLCLASIGDLQPGPPLLALLERMGISMATLTPTALTGMDWQPLPLLRGLMVAGEFCPPAVAARWARGRRFYNGYGPTECAVASTTYLRAPEDEQMPLGQTLANLDLFLLDSEMEPVPPGAIGEIYLGGVGLARGYLGRPGLTAQRFLPNPHGPPGARLYRTGDLAYRGPDNGLWFAGRADHQVKVRGYRIELGEIEAALTRHPAIDNAVVLVRQDEVGRRFLVAHLESKTKVEAQALRDFLGQRLPGYMIPARFICHRALPQTPNAKADRAALARVPLPSQASRAESGQPRGPEEQTLCAIWARVLKLDRVGRDDNFLSLGGDSILAIQAVAKANTAGLPITIKQIMNPATQTVAALVQALAGQEAPDQARQQEELATAPLTPIQQWFFDLASPEPHHYNMSLLLRVPSGLDAARLEHAGQALVDHHQALRLRFAPEGGVWRQTLGQVTARPCLTVVDLSRLEPGAVSQRLREECRGFQRALDLARPPLMHLALLRLPEPMGDRLLMVLHHLAVDAVSCQFLVEDLFDGYLQAGESPEIKLPAPSTPFLRWSSRLAAYAASPDALQELTHWTSLPPAGPPLPRRPGAPQAPATSGDYDQESLVLDQEATAVLLRQAPWVTGCRIHELILAALARAVTNITGGETVSVELEGNGRHVPFSGVNVSRTVGWFTTLAPVVLPVPGRSDLASLLHGVRAAVRGQPGQGFGYGLLRHLCSRDQVRQTLANRGRPEILFNYLGQWDEGWATAMPVSMAGEDAGPSFSPATPLPYTLQVEAMVLDGRLRLDCRFPPALLERSLVASVLRSIKDTLDQIQEASAPGPQGRRFGLAPQQLAMLGHSFSHPGSDAYWLQNVFRVDGELPPQRIQALWRQVLARHAMLRGCFHWPAHGLPTQSFTPAVQATWREEDWRGLDPPALESRLETFLAEQRRQGLGSGEAPPISFTLARTDYQWRLIWTLHHAVMDGWSMSAVRQDLERAPAFLDQGSEPPEPGASMTDFLGWLQRQDQAGARSFWHKELLGMDPKAVWPAGRAGYHFGERQRLTQPGTGQALAGLARRHNLTLATVALGAWALVQSRLSASPEVVFGVTTALRPPELPGIGEIVGPLTNTLPLRLHLDPRQSLVDWLTQMQARRTAQTPHAHLPLAELAQAAGLPDGDALFGTAVRIQNHPAEPEAGIESWLEVLRVWDFWHYPLNIEVALGEGLSLILTWDEELLSTPRAEAILEELAGTMELFATQGLDRKLPSYLNGPTAVA
jgi:amino acid adenylation domain-containing protein/non-ribosomal peptide synthase protein (TIGR01720 family)